MKKQPDCAPRVTERRLARRKIYLLDEHGNRMTVSAVQSEPRDPEVELCTQTVGRRRTRQPSPAWRIPAASALLLSRMIDRVLELASGGEESWPATRCPDCGSALIDDFAPIPATGARHLTISTQLVPEPRTRDSVLLLERWDCKESGERVPAGPRVELSLTQAHVLRDALLACHDACVKATLPTEAKVKRPRQYRFKSPTRTGAGEKHNRPRRAFAPNMSV